MIKGKLHGERGGEIISKPTEGGSTLSHHCYTSPAKLSLSLSSHCKPLAIFPCFEHSHFQPPDTDLERCDNPQYYLNDEKIPHRKLDIFTILHFQATNSETLRVFQSFTSLHSDSTLTPGIFQARAYKITHSNASFTSAVWKKKQQTIAFWDIKQLHFCKNQWLFTGTFPSNGNTHNILINHVFLTAKMKAHPTLLHTNF